MLKTNIIVKNKVSLLHYYGNSRRQQLKNRHVILHFDKNSTQSNCNTIVDKVTQRQNLERNYNRQTKHLTSKQSQKTQH